jgi:hypothetical protein
MSAEQHVSKATIRHLLRAMLALMASSGVFVEMSRPLVSCSFRYLSTKVCVRERERARAREREG